MLKTERIAKNFQMAFNQHFGYAKIKGILEIINLFSAFYAVVSKRFRTFAADISKTQTVRQSTRQIFSVGVPTSRNQKKASAKEENSKLKISQLFTLTDFLFLPKTPYFSMLNRKPTAE